MGDRGGLVEKKGLFYPTQQFRPAPRPSLSEACCAQAGAAARVVFGLPTLDTLRNWTPWFRWGATGGDLGKDEGPIDLEAQAPVAKRPRGQ